MVTANPGLVGSAPGTRAAPGATADRKRHRSPSAGSGEPSRAAPIEDAALVALLADALSTEPRRAPATPASTAAEPPIVEAILPPTPAPRAPPSLPRLPDEDFDASGSAGPAARAWLQRRRRQRWRALAGSAGAWMVTLVVILVTVAIGFAIAAGPDLAMQVARRTASAVQAGAAAIADLLARMPRP